MTGHLKDRQALEELVSRYISNENVDLQCERVELQDLTNRVKERVTTASTDLFGLRILEILKDQRSMIMCFFVSLLLSSCY